MPTNILMPALSPTMEKGNLAKWLKKEGDTIKSGDVIAEIETDKATMEVEAVDEGVLAKIVVPEGTADVPVNQLIGLIASDGEDVAAVASGGGAEAPAAAANGSVPAPQAAPAGALVVPEGHQYERAPKLEPVDARPASNGAAPQANGAAPAGGRALASPLARRVAKAAGLDVASVKGSGPHGRVVERDVRSAIANPSKSAPAAAQAPAPPAPVPQAAPAPAPAVPAPITAKPAGASDEQVRKMFPAGSYEEVPHDGMRKTIARRLSEAKQTIPHFYLSADCDLDALMALREQINASAAKDKDGKPAFKLSVNDFIIKALALALKRVPEANVSWTEGAMLKHRHADVGVAVSIPGGLITPYRPRGRDQDPVDHLGRGEGHGGAREDAEAEAHRIRGRHHGGVEPRHVRGEELPGHRQPAARHHSGGRRGREAGRREEWRAGGRDRHDGDAVDGPPRGGRRARCRADERLQGLHRASDEHAGLNGGSPRGLLHHAPRGPPPPLRGGGSPPDTLRFLLCGAEEGDRAQRGGGGDGAAR